MKSIALDLTRASLSQLSFAFYFHSSFSQYFDRLYNCRSQFERQRYSRLIKFVVVARRTKTLKTAKSSSECYSSCCSKSDIAPFFVTQVSCISRKINTAPSRIARRSSELRRSRHNSTSSRVFYSCFRSKILSLNRSRSSFNMRCNFAVCSKCEVVDATEGEFEDENALIVAEVGVESIKSDPVARKVVSKAISLYHLMIKETTRSHFLSTRRFW